MEKKIFQKVLQVFYGQYRSKSRLYLAKCLASNLLYQHWGRFFHAIWM